MEETSRKVLAELQKPKVVVDRVHDISDCINRCWIRGPDEWAITLKMEFDAKVYAMFAGFTLWGYVFPVEIQYQDPEDDHHTFKGRAQLSEGCIFLSDEKQWMDIVFEGIGELKVGDTEL